MTLVWIVIGLAAVAELARRIWHERRKTDLGCVSDQWLAERRSTDMSDRQR